MGLRMRILGFFKETLAGWWKRLGQEAVDCIVCEPDLGPALRQVPTGPYAEKIIEKLEPLFFGFYRTSI